MSLRISDLVSRNYEGFNDILHLLWERGHVIVGS